MTRVLLLLLVLLSTSLASAQEFKLEITPNNPAAPRAEYQTVVAVFLGYDLGAGDTLETETRAWREERTYPLPAGKVGIFEQSWPENPEGRDLAFRDPMDPLPRFRADSLDLTKMDIRLKPILDSFVMRWILFVDPSNGASQPNDTMRLTWDKNRIPSIVKHLIMSYKNGRQIIDMKLANTVTLFGDSLRSNGGSQNVGITLYYNQGLPAGVRYANANRVKLSAYPNPAIAHTKLLLELESTDYVSLVIYDVQGRVVMTHSFQGHPGVNEIEVSREALGLASGTYIVRAMIGSGSEQVMQTTSLRIQ